MNRRPTQGQPDPLRAETEAAAIKATIGRLLGLLSWKPTMVEYPALAAEIRRLAEWLVITSEQTGHSPGRHRADGGQPSVTGRQAEAELELELAAVQTPTEFVTQLRQQIAQSGLTLREIAAVAKQKRVYSLHRIDLFGDGFDEGVSRLVTAIRQAFGPRCALAGWPDVEEVLFG
jgi:hypothetical protein